MLVFDRLWRFAGFSKTGIGRKRKSSDFSKARHNNPHTSAGGAFFILLISAIVFFALLSDDDDESTSADDGAAVVDPYYEDQDREAGAGFDEQGDGVYRDQSGMPLPDQDEEPTYDEGGMLVPD